MRAVVARLVEVHVQRQVVRGELGLGRRFAVAAVERPEPAEGDEEHHAHVVLFGRRLAVLALGEGDAAGGEAGDGDERIERDRVARSERFERPRRRCAGSP